MASSTSPIPLLDPSKQGTTKSTHPSAETDQKITSIFNDSKLSEEYSPGDGPTSLPGIFSPFICPYKIITNLKKFITSNSEIQLHAFLKLFSNSLFLVASIQYILSAIKVFSSTTRITSFLAIIGTTIEMIHESICALKQYIFRNHNSTFPTILLKEISSVTPTTSTEKIKKVFHKYLHFITSNQELLKKYETEDVISSLKDQISTFQGNTKIPSEQLQEIKRKIYHLHLSILQNNYNLGTSNLDDANSQTILANKHLFIRRIGTSTNSALFNDIEQNISSLLKKLQSKNSPALRQEIENELNTAIEKTEQIIQEIDLQSKKKLYIHLVGLLATILSLIGYTLLLLPYDSRLIKEIILVFILGTGVSLGQYLWHNGTLGLPGWEFSWAKSIKDISDLFKKIAKYLPKHDPTYTQPHYPQIISPKC